jgi:hypothetical protein
MTTVAEYARLHGLSWSGAKKRLTRTGERRVPRNHTPPETVARIRQLLADGGQHWWVAEQTGVSRSTVSAIANGHRHKSKEQRT